MIWFPRLFWILDPYFDGSLPVECPLNSPTNPSLALPVHHSHDSNQPWYPPVNGFTIDVENTSGGFSTSGFDSRVNPQISWSSYYMGNIWLIYGWYMANIWVIYGSYMGHTWVILSHQWTRLALKVSHSILPIFLVIPAIDIPWCSQIIPTIFPLSPINSW